MLNYVTQHYPKYWYWTGTRNLVDEHVGHYWAVEVPVNCRYAVQHTEEWGDLYVREVVWEFSPTESCDTAVPTTAILQLRVIGFLIPDNPWGALSSASLDVNTVAQWKVPFSENCLPRRNTSFPRVPLLLCVDSLLREPLSRNASGVFFYLAVVA